MLGWIYQWLLSFVARVLSWFGVSFGAKDVSDMVEAAEKVQKGGQSDEPHDADQGVQPYSGPSQPPALLP